MLHLLLQFGLFLAEVIVIVAAILIVFAGILALAGKGKMKGKGRIIIRSLNKHYENIAKALREEMLSKCALKKWLKEKKQQEKAQEKAEKQRQKQAKKTRKKSNPEQITEEKPRVFVIHFDGDLRAHAAQPLREEVTAILTVAQPTDEVIVCIQSGGGVVHGYGLAASQLQRIKDRNIHLTVAIDTIAASGGYLMACVADRILAAPFAIVGSIGVIAQLPNFHRLLKKHNVDFEQIMAGEYKRTLTVFGENTREGRKKFQADVDDTHVLFKDFVQQHRPQLDMQKVATGEYWLGTRALALQLVDEIKTSDDYLLDASQNKKLYEIEFKEKKKLCDKLSGGLSKIYDSMFARQMP